jgi:hypothetical protein
MIPSVIQASWEAKNIQLISPDPDAFEPLQVNLVPFQIDITPYV